MSTVAGPGGIGVLDLQGGVQEHLDHLRRIGIAARPVKRAAELAGLAGLIIPGGESTCLARLLNIFGLDTVLRQAHGDGLKLWGTCAGTILLAREPIPLTFIRAPKIVRAGPGVRVLLQLDDYIAAAEDEQILVTVFHPELTPSLAFHRYFAHKCGFDIAGDNDAGLDPDWTPLSWTRFSPHA